MSPPGTGARVLRAVLAIVALGLACIAHAGITVHIHGLGSDEEGNVKSQLGLLAYAKRLEDKPPDPAEVERLAGQADADIRRALQPFGWYTPTIEDSLHHDGNDWVASYTINAGPETDVTAIDIKLTGPGSTLAALKQAAHHRWPLHVGKRLKHQDYATVKERLLNAAHEQGFFQARYTRHKLRVEPKKHSAQALLTLSTGPRFYFGKITVEQKTPRLRESVIRRYLKIHAGEPFKPSELLSTQFALSDLGYFQSVRVEPQSDDLGSDRRVPVSVNLSYAKPFVYRFGAGYGTDTGARALAGVTWRRVNSRGHTFSFDLRPSQKISSAVARYGIPFGGVPGQQYQVTGQALQQNFRGINERLYSVEGARIKLEGYLQRRYYLIYVNDTYTIGGEPRRHSSLLMPGVRFSRSSTDNPVFPRHGWSAFLDLHGATGHDGISTVSFVKVHFKVKGVIPLGWRWRILARGEEGAIISSSFDHLPPSQRFFAGGIGSVRGYSYRSLAPRNKYGRIAGGKYLTTGSLELDWAVHRPFVLAAFVDAGGADNVPNVRLHFGAGLGIRYLAPFGTLALDLAHPLDRGASPVRVDIAVRVGL